MTLHEFAAKHRLKLTSKPEDGGESTIAGKQGDIYQHNANELAVAYMPGLSGGRGVGTWHPKIWNGFCRAAEALAMTVRQRGDSEGCITFNPANPEQTKLALKIARVRPKRTISPERSATLAAQLAKFRSKPSQKTLLAV